MMNTLIESERASESEFSSFITSLDPQERIYLESSYIKQNIEAFKNIRKYNYLKASQLYKECITIATQLNDEYKITDSQCNYAIAIYYNGKLKESLKLLEKCYGIILKKKNPSKNISSYLVTKMAIVNMKIICNLIIVLLSLNQVTKANSCFKSLLGLFKEYDDDYETQNQLLKTVLYVFFRIESLVKIKIDQNIISKKIEIDEGDVEGSEKHKEVILKILSSFHYAMKNKNIETWLNCLFNEIENLKALGDYNGLIYALFNYNSFLYYLSSQKKDANDESTITMQNCKNKILSIITALTGEDNFSEEEVNTILKSFQEKIEYIMMLYKILTDFEQSQINKQKKSEKKKGGKKGKNNNFFILLLLTYSQNYILKNITDKKLCEQIYSQIDITKKLIKEDKTDLSNLKLKFLSPDINKAFSVLIQNLLYIYGKSKKKKGFEIFYNNYYKFKVYEINNRIKKMFETNYYKMAEGNQVMKINYSSFGLQNLFYKFDYDKDCIQVYKGDENDYQKNYDKSYKFDKIHKFFFGVKTENIKKKFKKLKGCDKQWNFMSFKYGDKTVDLFMDNFSIREWFHGLFFYFQQSQRIHKISSETSFILGTAKAKMTYTMIFANINDIELKFQIKGLVDEYGVYNKKISFVRTLLLYKKCGKI